MPDQTPDPTEFLGNSPPRTLHDGFFKRVFSDPALAADELRAVLPPELVVHIDWGSLRPAPANFVSAVFHQRYGDLVFQARLVGGGEVLLWFLLEHQSTEDAWMPLRVVGIQHAMWQQWRDHNKAVTHVPAIVPVVVYHGTQPWRAATELGQLYALSDTTRAELGEHLTRCKLVLDDLCAIEDRQLKARHMDVYARLALFAMARAAADNFLELLETAWHQELTLVLTSDPERAADVLLYIFYTSPRTDKDTLRQLIRSVPGASRSIEEAMNTGYEKIEKMIQQGMEQGMEQGQRGILLRLLARRFGPLPGEVTARVAAAHTEELEQWAERVLDARQLDDVFAA